MRGRCIKCGLPWIIANKRNRLRRTNTESGKQREYKFSFSIAEKRGIVKCLI